MKIIVAGAGLVGSNIARYLASTGNDVTVIDQRPELVRMLEDHLDIQGMIGHAAHPDSLEKAAAGDADMVSIEGIDIDRTNHIVHIDGVELILTPTEFRLLWTLARQPGRTFNRYELLDCARGEDANSTERTIDVHIRALRKKLGDRAALIETMRGVGYRFKPGKSN